MARGPEGDFWKKVRDGWWPEHAIRIEASLGEVDPGTPDTVLSAGGRGGYVELKVWPDNVSAVQLAWHLDACDRGAYAMVLSELSDGSVWLGRADAYDSLVRRIAQAEVVRPKGKSYLSRRGPEGIVLQAALKMIRCALIGTTRRTR